MIDLVNRQQTASLQQPSSTAIAVDELFKEDSVSDSDTTNKDPKHLSHQTQ